MSKNERRCHCCGMGESETESPIAPGDRGCCAACAAPPPLMTWRDVVAAMRPMRHDEAREEREAVREDMSERTFHR